MCLTSLKAELKHVAFTWADSGFMWTLSAQKGYYSIAPLCNFFLLLHVKSKVVMARTTILPTPAHHWHFTEEGVHAS